MSRGSEVTDQDRADQTHRIGFKNICGHARAVADIVTDVIGNRGRIAWVIFVQVLLDLADQIRADIGGFGVNATAQTSEHTDQ